MRFRRLKKEVGAALAINEKLVKFDLSEDFYIKTRCLKCGEKQDSTDDEMAIAPETFECECGGEIWATCGMAWVESHEEAFWKILKTTEDIKIPTKSRKWLVGQEKPMERELMELARWVYKLKQKQQAYRNAEVVKLADLEKTLRLAAPSLNPSDRPIKDRSIIELNKKTFRVHYLSDDKALLEPGNFMKENPGPYILRISEPGTGKTLASKIIGEELESLYKENDIQLTDVLTMENVVDGQRPLVRQVPCHAVQGKGCLAPRIMMQAERSAVVETKQRQQLIMSFLMIGIIFGGALMATGLFMMGLFVMAVGLVDAWFQYSSGFLGYIVAGVSLMAFPLFILILGGNMIFGNANRKDILNTPYPIVSHGDKPKYVQSATVSDSATLMGSIQWNAYGNTPGLTGPLHKRVVAGVVHRASDMIVDIDEIKNLQAHTAIELLSVMEDGESEIKTRGSHGMGTTESSAILAIATAEPVPADFMLVANGNMDMLDDPHSVLNTIRAFFDRFNYGDVIYYETHLDATFRNQVKILQVITDEISRFRLFPMEKDGMRRLIEYMRSRAANNKRLKIMFRYTIKVILKSFEIALLRGDTIIRAADVERAIDEFCDNIREQSLKEMMVNRKPFKIITSKGSEIGQVNGLAVLSVPGAEGRSAGESFPVVAKVFPNPGWKLEAQDRFIVTGTAMDQESQVRQSKEHVRTAIRTLYGIDLAYQAYAHVSFAQQFSVDGPSAGTTMTLALMSVLGDPRAACKCGHKGEEHENRYGKCAQCQCAEISRKPVPIRQDVAVTGTIELIPDSNHPNNVRVGSIGGVPDKIKGAAAAGCKYVIIPQENWENTLTKEQYPCEVFGASNILAYFDLLRGDTNTLNGLLAMRKPKEA